ncbi:MAG TPA: GNAT family N-acetyltransferase [Ktedonosporobacter sp.]|nr:GNAT family N-acetyltransferase [Ktedonosporobacter sp.]
MHDFSLVEQAPTLDEYQRLRVAVGWGEADALAAQKSIDNTLYWVCVLKDDIVVGCGRVIGDGGLCFYVQDIIVLPAYQGQGWGGRIMEKVMDYVRANAHQGGFVGLMAAKGVEDFYLKYGFMKRPDHRYGPGMILFWH